MEIRIKDKDGTNLWIPLPTGLVCNRFTAAIAAKAVAEQGISLSAGQLSRLFAVCRTFKRTHPDWVLVEVDSTDGDYVRVRL